MRKILLLSTLMILGCSNKPETEFSANETEREVDTIYASSMSGTPSYKRFIVQLSDTAGLNDLRFEVGKTDYLKVSIPRFNEYPIFIENAANVSIGESDSTNGIFELTPLDTTFTIEFWQNYDSGNVVLKHTLTDSGFSVMPLNGYQQSGSRTFKALKKSVANKR